MMSISYNHRKISSIFFFIGCVTSAPDGSSPRGYGGALVLCHRLEDFFPSNYIFDMPYYILAPEAMVEHLC
jgi:hypothetical protein